MSAKWHKAHIPDLRYACPLPSLLMNEVLPAREVRERAVQRIEMLRLSAGINRRFPCNLVKSPCISQICRERRVGL
jgi:hypothetical protein